MRKILDSATQRRIPGAAMLLSLLLGAGAAIAGGGTPVDCTRLFGSSVSGALFSVDLETGSVTEIGIMEKNLATEIEYDDATGVLYAEEYGGLPGLHILDPTTGLTLDLLQHTVGNLTGLEFVGDTLYGTFTPGAGPSPSELVTVDLVSGQLQSIGATGWGPISGLAYDPSSETMYGVTGAGPGYLLRLDLETGVATAYADTGLFRVGSIEFGPDGNLYGGRTDSPDELPTSVFQIDVETGEVTDIGPTGYSITGLTACSGAGAADADADGVLDAEDVCPESILTPTVKIGKCETHVTNDIVSGGCSVSDLVANCESQSSVGAYRHCVRQVVQDLPSKVLAVSEKIRVYRCASKTSNPSTLSKHEFRGSFVGR